ncbi:hypothetical protein Tco_1453375, partial [Tanacetum coccineum]
VLKIHTDDNVADLLTKAFDGPRFEYLVVHIGMVDMVLCGILFSCDCRLVSAGSTMILLVVILSADRLVSAGSTMILLVVILSADRLCVPAVFMFDIAGWLVFATSHLVSAGNIQTCWCTNISAESIVYAAHILILLLTGFESGFC